MTNLVVFEDKVKNCNSEILSLKLGDIPNVKLIYGQDDFQKIKSSCTLELIIILTHKSQFMSKWDTEKLPSDVPVVLLTNINYESIVFIQTLIESLGYFKDINVENNELSKSLDFISNNLYESDLSLDKVASHVFMNKCQYSRFFLEKVGIGFKNYVINKRIQKAKQLLENGLSVTEVCYSIGYNDLTHFSRMFKRIVGENPSVYKTKFLKGVS